jgi:hypothetical protein
VTAYVLSWLAIAVVLLVVKGDRLTAGFFHEPDTAAESVATMADFHRALALSNLTGGSRDYRVLFVYSGLVHGLFSR